MFCLIPRRTRGYPPHLGGYSIPPYGPPPINIYCSHSLPKTRYTLDNRALGWCEVGPFRGKREREKNPRLTRARATARRGEVTTVLVNSPKNPGDPQTPPRHLYSLPDIVMVVGFVFDPSPSLDTLRTYVLYDEPESEDQNTLLIFCTKATHTKQRMASKQ